MGEPLFIYPTTLSPDLQPANLFQESIVEHTKQDLAVLLLRHGYAVLTMIPSAAERTLPPP